MTQACPARACPARAMFLFLSRRHARRRPAPIVFLSIDAFVGIYSG